MHPGGTGSPPSPGAPGASRVAPGWASCLRARQPRGRSGWPQAAPRGSGPHAETHSGFLQVGGPCGQGSRLAPAGGRALQRAAPPLREADCVFPCLSPDEESSQKFIPFVGVSTAQAAVALPAILLPSCSAAGRPRSANVISMSSSSCDTVQNLLQLEQTTCLRIPPALKSLLHRVGSEPRRC